jgi:predicted nucleic acid-binding protein
VQAITPGVVEDVRYLTQRYQISYWNAAIVTAARHANCTALLMEDLNHGQEYGGVKTENPLLAT